MPQQIKMLLALAAGCCAAGAVCAALLYPLPAVLLLIAAAGLCAGGVTGLLRGHSERLRAEQERAGELERRLEEERAGVLTAQQESRDKILRFYSEISHGLRIPISIITGYSDILNKDMVTEESVRREYIQKINDQIGYMDSLLRQLLMEARNDVGVATILPEEVDLLELLSRVAEEMGAVFQRYNTIVRVVSDQRSIPVMADVTQLSKVFYNILENALKYMGREGSVNITCSYSGEDEVLVIIKDDGLGLPAEETGRIFDLNYQGSNKTSGNGLGLHLVKVGIEAHGGSIFAKSDVGKGMGIYITLPVSAKDRRQIQQEER